MTLGLGFAPIASTPIASLPQSGAAAFTPTITCGNVATVGAVYIAPVPMVIVGSNAVSFGAIAMPFIDWAPQLEAFYPVTVSGLTVLRYQPNARRVRAWLRSFNPVTFGTMTLP